MQAGLSAEQAAKFHGDAHIALHLDLAEHEGGLSALAAGDDVQQVFELHLDGTVGRAVIIGDGVGGRGAIEADQAIRAEVQLDDVRQAHISIELATQLLGQFRKIHRFASLGADVASGFLHGRCRCGPERAKKDALAVPGFRVKKERPPNWAAFLKLAKRKLTEQQLRQQQRQQPEQQRQQQRRQRQQQRQQQQQRQRQQRRQRLHQRR